MRFAAHTPDTATGRAVDLLGDIVGRTGSAGAMVRTMAGSPSVLGGYLELSRAVKRSRLERAVSERISLTVQARLGCALCLEAHTAGARAAGVSDSEIALAKQGTSADPAIAAAVAYGHQVDTTLRRSPLRPSMSSVGSATEIVTSSTSSRSSP